MFILGNFIGALASVINIALNIYMWIIIIRALISWVNPDPFNPVVRFLYQSTEPVLQPIRRQLPWRVGIDFSPLIALLAIIFLRAFLVQSLFQLANSFR